MKLQDILEIKEIYRSTNVTPFFVIYEKTLEREVYMSSRHATEGKGKTKAIIRILKGDADSGSMERLAEYIIDES
ncbi:hypothetical protein [Alkalihalobacillus sp. BA299]|uniref:hypothetical protein n=1 Tax=Alkalihalobacillus sp. BA299 TaxID=2815938 RepID=UPI001ADCA4FD|nr:hypothetical protein [Alkalihalobacillus sp. BA299]